MGDSSEIDYEKVKSGLEDKSIILLDVRTKEERTEKHGAIPGSKHIWGKLSSTSSLMQWENIKHLYFRTVTNDVVLEYISTNNSKY